MRRLVDKALSSPFLREQIAPYTSPYLAIDKKVLGKFVDLITPLRDELQSKHKGTYSPELIDRELCYALERDFGSSFGRFFREQAQALITQQVNKVGGMIEEAIKNKDREKALQEIHKLINDKPKETKGKQLMGKVTSLWGKVTKKDD